MPQPSALANKLAIITGASSGIGRAAAEELSALGAHVVITARRKEKLDDLALALAGKGTKVLPLQSDASKETDIASLVTRAKQFSPTGKIDIVLANAGRGLAGGLLSSDTDQWRQLYDVNVLGVAHLLRLTGQIMAEQQSGDILVISSAVGQNISPFSGFYGSSKFAVGAMAEALRRELCSKNVRVTTIKPGLVESEFQEVAGYNHDNFYRNVEKFGKMLDPADVARAIAFVVTQPPHVHLNDIVIRPTKQDYP